MKLIQAHPSLAQQVYDVIVDEICNGKLPAGAHLVQEKLAMRLGVSRQPVQQAMALLKSDRMVEEIGRRGLQVTRLDIDLMRHHYDIRAALDGLAARMAAARARDDKDISRDISRRGKRIIKLGKQAVLRGNVSDLVRHDAAFHELLYEASGNPLLSRTAETHWRFLRRAMGEVLRHAELPEEIWRQHACILDAAATGDPVRAESLAVEHGIRACENLSAKLRRNDAIGPVKHSDC